MVFPGDWSWGDKGREGVGTGLEYSSGVGRERGQRGGRRRDRVMKRRERQWQEGMGKVRGGGR